MTVAPDSGPGITRVMQDLGSILFQVNKKPSQHFRVETPLLAAIVKGTTFTVNVELNANSVHVAEGLVEVRANQGGATKDVGAGATGSIARDAPAQLSVLAPGAAAFDAVEVSVAALDYTAVTGGLVEGPVAPGAAGAGVVSGQRTGNTPTSVAGVEQAAGGAGPSSDIRATPASASSNGSGDRTAATVVLAAVTPPDIGAASGGNNGSGGNPAIGSSNANGDAGPGPGSGNGSAAANSNAGGNGNGAGNGNSGGESGGNGNSNAGGNGNAGANSNAGANGNSGGNSGGSGAATGGTTNSGGNGNSGGESGGSANSNAGGNGNGTGNGNSGGSGAATGGNSNAGGKKG